MRTSRIPEYGSASADGMLQWFAEMSVRDLLFHPDDEPSTIVDLGTGRALFSAEECRVLDGIMSGMFAKHGSKVYEACYPVFMRKAGINVPLDC